MSFSLVFDTLLEASFRVTVIAGLIAFVLAAFRVKSPATKHAAWTAVMLTMLLLPVISGWVPGIPMPAWLPALPVAVVRSPAISSVQSLPTTAIAPDAVSQQRLAARPAIQQSGAVPAGDTRPRGGSVQQAIDWRDVAVLVWFAISGIFLLRELAGWWRARRLAAEAVMTSVGDGTYQSDRVMTPVVAGLYRPRVLVPASWSKWGDGVRRMVLAHERAHIKRRDPLVAATARVNRAIFWFHPLSWWLERHLSRLAEWASDEAVVRNVDDSRLYAALLVEMAHRLRHHGHRVAWQGIGIVSARRLEDRVDQLLQGPTPQLSRRLKATLASACGLFVVAGIACGTQAAPLAEDPAVAKEIADRAAAVARYEAAMNLTLDDVAQLEAAVAKNPEDLVTTEKLLTFYQQRGQKLMGWDRMLAARRSHVLRMIAAHPESPLAAWPFARNADPLGYEKARLLWMDRIERDVTLEMLSGAARFFERSEKPIAEQLLLRAQAADPQGPRPRVVNGMYNVPWSRRLGELYAMAIVGSDGQLSVETVKSVNAEQAHGQFAKLARQKIDESNDVQLLVGAAVYLTRRASEVKLDFDQAALGLSYAEKALKLDPTSAAAKQILSIAAHNADWDSQIRHFGKPAHTLDVTAFNGLPERAKLAYAIDFLYAGSITQRPYNRESVFESLKDRAEATQFLVDKSDASAVPPGLQASIHLAFGTFALHQGNRREAVRRLGLAASAVPTGSAIANPSIFDYSWGTKLVYDLLDAGERESVAVFYDAIARSLEGPDRTPYEDAAKAIRAGRMPAGYQRYKAQAK